MEKQHMRNSKHLLALGLAGILALGATSPSIAAPAVANTVVSKAATGDTINVRWGWRGGWRRGSGFGIGLALGLAGAALAVPSYGCPYGACGGPYYGYAYGPAYAYAPAYAPAYLGWGWRRQYWRDYATGP
jgi:hypothetical protein